jgi:hypothetical protein
MKRLLSLALALLAAMPFGTPVYAAQADIDLLKNYVGEWRGRGIAQFSDTGKDETIVCRMTITDSEPTKVTFNGRCTIAGRTLALAGTVAYVEAASRYEAIMSSVASFQGVAIGRRQGNNIAFNLIDRNAESGEHRVDAALSLEGNGIHMDFKIANVNTGWSTIAQIPFEVQ